MDQQVTAKNNSVFRILIWTNLGLAITNMGSALSSEPGTRRYILFAVAVLFIICAVMCFLKTRSASKLENRED